MSKETVRTQKQLLAENENQRARLEEAEETLRAIRGGEVDAIVVSSGGDEEIFTLESAREYLATANQSRLALLSVVEDQKQAEEKLRSAHEFLQSVQDALSAHIAILDDEGNIVQVNSGWRDFGIRNGQSHSNHCIGMNYLDVCDSAKGPDAEDAILIAKAIRKVRGGGKDEILVEYPCHAPHEQRWFVARITSFENNAQKWIVVAHENITERKQALDALQEKQHLLSEAQSIGHIGSWNYDIPADTLQYSDEMYHLLDIPVQEFQHNKAGFFTLIYPADQPMVAKWLEDIRAGRQVQELDFRLFYKSGELRYLHTKGAVIFDSAGDPVRFTGTAQDISERKLAEIQIRQQLQRLTALGKIDQAIISTFNLGTMMETILSQVVVQLQVDAADVLLLHPNAEMLNYVAGQGFRAQSVETAQVSVGNSMAGQAVKGRRLIKIENLAGQSRDSQLSDRLAGEGFVSYFGIPLITKGKVQGVLEIFHRTPLHPYAEWVDFLNTLAGQLAIAIENASLFANLEKFNRELSQAYDTTIEGWSRALDLRDKETEGHTQRVTEMTLSLARKFNFTDKQMLYLRWGALLHDIGKMGIPDSILLKPDKLSAEEWAIMRKHPQYAYDLLQPIAFLTPALDIPFCHHEKWDGTGYPRGLRGEAIPLQARIFAVVDVWDALRSDRPYRSAWPQEEVRAYILGLSGTDFDPQVVDAFMLLM